MSFADGSPLAFILAAVIAAVALLAVGLYLAHSRLGAGKPDIASATLHGAGPFTLTVAAPPAGPVDLFIRYAVAFPFFKPSGGPTSRTFGLIVELVADGQVLTFGHGGTHPAGLLEFEGLAHYMTSFRPGNLGITDRGRRLAWRRSAEGSSFARRPVAGPFDALPPVSGSCLRPRTLPAQRRADLPPREMRPAASAGWAAWMRTADLRLNDACDAGAVGCGDWWYPFVVPRRDER
ncbi:hypothetical protein WME73_17325 [Sorangium sp. So ce302]|uniref:hypothetical protein n=1 Tax=Sorangium sp. So ce302 TaxID=3133297 RepID=UPI003F5EA11A